MTMQTANAMLALGGDKATTVPKYGVTAAEIAVLIAIHGEDAVFDIEPLKEKALDPETKRVRTNRAELARLNLIYGGAKDGNGASIVGNMFPGAAARVFETLAELNLPREFYKATARVEVEPEAEDVEGPMADEDDLDAVLEPALAPEPAPAKGKKADDGIFK